MRVSLISILTFCLLLMTSCGDRASTGSSGSGGSGGGGGGSGAGGGGGAGTPGLQISHGGTQYARNGTIDLGSINHQSGTQSLLFIMENDAANIVNLSNMPNPVTLSGAPGYTVLLQPSIGLLAANSGNTSSFIIEFTPDSLGVNNTTVQIDSDDAGGIFTLNLRAAVVSLSDPEIEIVEVESENTIETDGSDSPSLSNRTDFGPLPLGSSRFIDYEIRNTGNAELNLTDLVALSRIAIVGADAGNFWIVKQPDQRIPAGSSTDFRIGFSATSAAQSDYAADLILQSDDPDEEEIIIHLAGQYYNPQIGVTGRGQPINFLSINYTDANDTDFGAVPAGVTTKRIYTITNLGSQPLPVTSVNVAGPTDALGNPIFEVDLPPASNMLSAGESTEFTISFKAPTWGLFEGEVQVYNGDTALNPFTYTIAATGLAAEIQVTGNDVIIQDGDLDPSELDGTDLGTDMFIRQGSSQTFTITNTGNAALTFTDPAMVRVVPSSTTEFFLSPPPEPPVTVLLPGESWDFIVSNGRGSVIGYNEAMVIIPVSGTVVGDLDFNFAVSRIAVDPIVELRGNGLYIQPGDTTPRTADYTNFGDIDAGSWSVSLNGTVFQSGNLEINRTFYVHNVSSLADHDLYLDAERTPPAAAPAPYGYPNAVDSTNPIDLLDLPTVPAGVYPTPYVTPSGPTSATSPHFLSPSNFIGTLGTGTPNPGDIARIPTLNAYNNWLNSTGNGSLANVILFANPTNNLRAGDNIVFQGGSVNSANRMFTINTVASDGSWVTTVEPLTNSFVDATIYSVAVVDANTLQFPSDAHGSTYFSDLQVGDLLTIFNSAPGGPGQSNAGAYTITAIRNGTKQIDVTGPALVAPNTTGPVNATSANAGNNTLTFSPVDLSNIVVGSRLTINSGSNIGTYTVAGIDDAADSIETVEPLSTTETGAFTVTFTNVEYMSVARPENLFVIMRDFEIIQQPTQTQLAPSEFTPFTVRYRPRPTVAGNAVPNNARINIPMNDYVASGIRPVSSQLTFSITGRTVYPQMNVTGVTNFGTPFVGTDVDQVFTIQNLAAGNNDLTLENLPNYVTIAGPNAADFSLESVDIDDAIINPGELNQTFTIRFTPTAPGARNATLIIRNNDGATGGALHIQIFGNALPAPVVQLEKQGTAKEADFMSVRTPQRAGSTSLFTLR